MEERFYMCVLFWCSVSCHCQWFWTKLCKWFTYCVYACVYLYYFVVVFFGVCRKFWKPWTEMWNTKSGNTRIKVCEIWFLVLLQVLCWKWLTNLDLGQ